MQVRTINIRNTMNTAGRRFAPSLVLAVFLLFTAGIPAEGQLISVSPRFDTTSIWIGEQTNFMISLEQPADMYVTFPLLSDTLSRNIEILSEMPADTTQIGDNRIKINKFYRVTSFDRGEHFVEALPFVFFTGDDERVLNTNRVRLEVLAPDIDEEGSIYDIKSPLGIPLGIMEILPWLVLLLFASLVVWFIIRYVKHRKKESLLSETAIPSEPAHVIALRELKQLKSESLWQNGKVKEYYTRLTEIVRIYIERRFGIMAMERTSYEIIEQLGERNGVDRKVVDLLEECFSLADMVKFARARPGEEDHESSLNTAFHFVKASFDQALAEEKEEKNE